jgi:predicted Fe-S protein YdhL (DUF1289 family)
MSEEELLECPDSPCKLICSMERQSGYCFGCGRTQDEIAYWSVSSKSERDRILAELPARMPPLEIILAERRKLRRVNKRRGPKKEA